MRWSRDPQSSRGARLRTLLVLGVVVAVVMAMVAETPLRGSDAAPAWLHLGSPSAAGGSVQPPLDEPREPGLAAAKKSKGDKGHKDKQKADGKGKQQANGNGKHKQDKHQGNKKGKHKGDKRGKHKGDKQGKHKGDGKGKHKKGGQKADKKGKDKKDPQKQKSALRAAGDGAAASLTVAPVADAKVSEAEPTLNYGSSTDLLVDGGADPDLESYLRFDVAGVSLPVQQATLRLWVQDNGGTMNGPEIYTTDTDWTEKGLTWDTRPAPTGNVLDDTGRLIGSTWVEYNVTAAVSGDGPVTFVLRAQSDDGAVFDARETATPPQLVITFGEATPTPTQIPEPTATPTPEPTATPTPTLPPTSPATIAPVADGKVSEASPNLNYGASPQLLVDGGADPDVESYLRFDVAGVNPPVRQATLRLWVPPLGGTVDGPEVYPTGTNWTEGGLTWNTRPALTGGVLDDKGKLTGGSWVEYDVTAAVSGDGAYSFVLVPQTTDGTVFDSRQGANSPELVITLKDEAPSPTSTPDATPSPTPDPTPTPTPSPPPSPNPAPGDTLLAAGDIAGCSSSGDEATAALLDGLIGTVVTLGDNAYSSGTPQEFRQCYDPSWGQYKSRTRPAAGNHDYATSGAAGYFDYFGAAAGDPEQGYYSYEVGSWHIVALNSNCSKVGGCGVGSPQEQWLREDLAAHPATCTLAYWHHPRFSFGTYGNNTATQALWQALYEHRAEIVLTGHNHNYQRYAPQDATGLRDPGGIRQFVVGTGGKSHYALGSPPPNVEAFNGDTYGILQLTLRAQGYDWTFIPVAGKSFTDTGSDVCH